MPWTEFCTLLSGIMPETPLGQIVQLRSENNKERLKQFTPEQHRIRSAWRTRRKPASFTEADALRAMSSFQSFCRQHFTPERRIIP